MRDIDRGVAERPVPWGLRDMLSAGLATIALMGAGLVLAVAVALALRVDMRSPEQQRLMAFMLLGLEALMILPVWWWGLHKHGAEPRVLGLRGFALGRGLALTGLGLAGILAINVVWSQVLERMGWEGQPSLVPVFGQGWGGFAAALVVAAIVAPLAEELFFRGFIYAGLRDRFGLTAGLVVSSALFGVVHLTPSVMLPIVLMGVVFAWLYEATDSLWPPILLHALVNALAVIGLYAAELFGSLPT